MGDSRLRFSLAIPVTATLAPNRLFRGLLIIRVPFGRDGPLPTPLGSAQPDMHWTTCGVFPHNFHHSTIVKFVLSKSCGIPAHGGSQQGLSQGSMRHNQNSVVAVVLLPRKHFVPDAICPFPQFAGDNAMSTRFRTQSTCRGCPLSMPGRMRGNVLAKTSCPALPNHKNQFLSNRPASWRATNIGRAARARFLGRASGGNNKRP